MLFSKNFQSVVARYIIWFGFASLFFLSINGISALAQDGDIRREQARDIHDPDAPALSEGLGGLSDEVDGLTSSLDDGAIDVRQNGFLSDNRRPENQTDGDDGGVSVDGTDDDRDPRDRGFRGEIGDPRRTRILDGDLRAQHESAQRRAEVPQDGDYGVLIRDDNGADGGQERVILDQDAFLDATRLQGRSLNDERQRGRNRRPGDELLDGRSGQSGLAPPNGRGNGIADDGLSNANSDDRDDGSAVAVSARDRRLSPYEPVGIRVGSFRVVPEASVFGIYGDNVGQASGPKDADVALELRPSIVARSVWRRHALEVDASGTANFHKEFSSEDDREFLTNLRGRIDLTRRSNVEAEAGYSLSQQRRGTADSPGGAAENPDVHIKSGALALNHRFNRVSLRVRGEVVEEKYDDAALTTGGTSDEGDQDNREKRLSLRGTYEFDPGLSVFTEGLVERRDFKQASNSDGILRDSHSYGFRAGILFDNGSKLYGEVGVGFTHVRADDSRLEDVDGVTFDANVSWRPSALTTISLDASTDVDGTTVAGSLATLTYTANFRVQHELLEHFILSGGIGLDHVDYQGSSLVERTYRAELGAEYIFSREAAMIANYEYSAFDSNSPNSDYTSNQVRLGMRFRR